MLATMPDTPAPLPTARQLLERGDLDAAITAQLTAINDGVRRLGQAQAADLHLFGVILFARQDFAGAAQTFAQVRRLDPGWPAIDLNLAKSLVLCGQAATAVPLLERALQVQAEDIGALEALAHAQGLLGQREAAQAAGEQALRLKDRQSQPVLGLASRWPAGRPLPAVGRGQPQAVLSFSLFGAQPRYLLGALENVQAAARFYPGWVCRFHVDDSVPPDTLAALRQAGAELRSLPRPVRRTDALFWRFLVADDPQVGRFVVRDADSVVNAREAAAVQAWLGSERPFHVMRDHPAHTDLMLAGLWGGVAGWLPPLATLLDGFSYQPGAGARSADQRFLGERVWPLVRAHCLQHDSVFRVLGAQDFPAGSRLPGGRHVGDNAHAHRPASGAVAGQ
mgnify:CR=1 FL=1